MLNPMHCIAWIVRRRLKIVAQPFYTGLHLMHETIKPNWTMKKKLLAIASVLTVIFCSCAKQTSAPVPAEKKYNCVCEVQLEYVDHCGKDSLTDTLSIFSKSYSEASVACSGKNAYTSDDYVITARTCVIRWMAVEEFNITFVKDYLKKNAFPLGASQNKLSFPYCAESTVV